MDGLPSLCPFSVSVSVLRLPEMEDAGNACDERPTISSHATHTLRFQTTGAASQSKILAAHRHEEITPASADATCGQIANRETGET